VALAGGEVPSPPAGHADRRRADRGRVGLIFVGEMYGVQIDQLALVLGLTPRRAAAVVARWRAAGPAGSG